jgi:hypothetical protein
MTPEVIHLNCSIFLKNRTSGGIQKVLYTADKTSQSMLSLKMRHQIRDKSPKLKRNS